MPQFDRSNLVLTSVKYNNHPIEAIIDTGAGITVVLPSLFKRLNLSLRNSWEGPLLVIANGAVVQPEGCVNLEVIVDGILICVEAAVMALNGYELLLVNNALRQLESAHIANSKGKNSFFSIKLGTGEMDKETNNGTVSSHTSLTVPTKSIITITVDVNRPIPCMRMTNKILEPSSKVFLENGYSVGRLLLPIELPNKLEIELANFSRAEQWLNKGTVLGCISPVNLVGDLPVNEDQPTKNIELSDEILRFENAASDKLSPDERRVGLEL